MNIPLSYSKYNTFLSCPIKYAHNYLFKTVVEEETTYPLVLGQLTHLFIKLYNDCTLNKKEIKEIKDNTDVLYKYIDLKYPSLYGNKCEIKTMSVTSNVDKVINFIKNNEIVFFHALKLFNLYTDKFFPKVNQSSKYLSEMTFNNVQRITEESIVCYYGSIDLMFYKFLDDNLSYIYISDFKTGKSLYSYYYEQLFFYIYNLINYNMDFAKTSMINSSDDLDTISFIQNTVTDFSKVQLLLFNLREGVFEKKVLSEAKDDYDKFVDNLHNNISGNLYIMHKEKEILQAKDIYDKYQESHKYETAENCKINELSFTCNYCKFKELCDYRIKK